MSLLASTNARSGTGKNAVFSAGIDTTGATLLVGALVREGAELPTIGDSLFNGWQPLAELVQGGLRILFYYVENPAVGPGHTFSIGATTTLVYPTFGVGAFDVVNVFDQQNGATHASGTTLQPGTITPSAAVSLVVSAAIDKGSSNGFAIDSSFTRFLNLTEGSFASALGMGYKVKASATAENPTWTFDNTSAGAAAIASFIIGPPPFDGARVTQMTIEIASAGTFTPVPPTISGSLWQLNRFDLKVRPEERA